ncbi:MAG TPA: Rne/Rng family ribonuclease [Oligoflexia bacterium]|nr:Rne/Rng family ribonuclease [Oligoflexia bacterium]
MLINAIDSEECRIAILENGNVIELEVDSNTGRKLKGNIYKGRIARVEPSLQAAFVDIGTARNAFLQINDVKPSIKDDPLTNESAQRKNSSRSSRRGRYRQRIQDLLKEGDQIIVQVVKEEREMKGATLTTYLSLPGRYIVIIPGTDRSGISRRIKDLEMRSRLKRLAQELEIPEGIGAIIRTAGLDRSMSELSRDASLQLKLWEKIEAESRKVTAPALIYRDNDVATRVIRDYFTPEVREIVIDDQVSFNRVKEFVGEVMPRYRSRIKLYDLQQPIFSYYKIEDQVRSTLDREVKLPSGGAIILEPLEALVAIDVNSGKATNESNIEETAYKTNLEAADEIAKQLRLRDLGGLIVIDFIDMVSENHRNAVEKRIRDATRDDKARIEIGKISKFGLLEMSRQRLRTSITSQSFLGCTHCFGTGLVKTNECIALEALRKVQSALSAGQLGTVKIRMAPAPALFLLNNKRQRIGSLESQFNSQILILVDGRMHHDEYELEFDSSSTASSQVIKSTVSVASRIKEASVEDEDESQIEIAKQIEDEDEGESEETDDSDPTKRVSMPQVKPESSSSDQNDSEKEDFPNNTFESQPQAEEKLAVEPQDE